MALISLQNVSISFGGPKLLNDETLLIEPGERVCLLGRNGEGKSTLLKILSGEQVPDDGTVVLQSGVRVGLLEQAVPEAMGRSVLQVVQAAVDDGSEEWEAEQRANKVISLMGLSDDADFDSLSGGQKRRALLARALVQEPDVLILDEPTNHLDIESILWLENFLMRFSGSLLFVSHDRAFVRKLATRIVELDRGRLSSWDCGYDKFLQRRDEMLAAEDKQNAVFDKKLAQEEVWIRKGIQARRTRNEGRVRALKAMRSERGQRRERTGTVNLQLHEAERSGQRVIKVVNANYAWDDQVILQGLETTILRGDKIGIIGPNGCGKTTLLNVLLGQLAPDSGTVNHGTQLEVAYFDQHRAQLDDEKTVAQNVAGEEEFIMFNGKRRHIFSYLEDFLFEPARSRTPVKVLSGGERNRLLLARLFTQPSNVLVLDEPTNDLDSDTLDLLEDLLVEYSGTMLLVSHDRAFINNVVSSTLVFEGEGVVKEYAGGYDDWVDQRPVAPKAGLPKKKGAEPQKVSQAKARKMTNREREELKKLPGRIEQLEAELAALQETMSAPTFYQQAEELIRAGTEKADSIPKALEEAYARWEELETLR